MEIHYFNSDDFMKIEDNIDHCRKIFNPKSKNTKKETKRFDPVGPGNLHQPSTHLLFYIYSIFLLSNK